MAPFELGRDRTGGSPFGLPSVAPGRLGGGGPVGRASTTIQVGRMSPELRRQLETKAAAEGVSLAEAALRVLEVGAAREAAGLADYLTRVIEREIEG